MKTKLTPIHKWKLIYRLMDNIKTIMDTNYRSNEITENEVKDICDLIIKSINNFIYEK